MAPVALVQSQFVGQEVRLTVINRKIRSALLRQKPQVIGDGKTTVKNLIEQENGARRALQHVQTPYPVLDDSLVPLDLLQSTVVPAIGEVVELSKSTMIRGGASMYEILPEVHSSYIQAVESAIQGLGDGFFVVDLMVASYSQAATPDNYIFLEMNLAPALTLYYSCRDSDHFPIVEDYLGPMLERVLGEHISYQTPALHYSVAS